MNDQQRTLIISIVCVAKLFRYAEKHGYPLLNNVTLPRIGATRTILEALAADNGRNTTSQTTKFQSNIFRFKFTFSLVII